MTDKGPFVLSNRFLTYIRRVMTGAWRFFIALLCLVWLIPFSSKVNDDEWFYRCHWIYGPLHPEIEKLCQEKKDHGGLLNICVQSCVSSRSWNGPFYTENYYFRWCLLLEPQVWWSKQGDAAKIGLKVFFSVHGAFSSKRWSMIRREIVRSTIFKFF